MNLNYLQYNKNNQNVKQLHLQIAALRNGFLSYICLLGPLQIKPALEPRHHDFVHEHDPYSMEHQNSICLDQR